MSGRILTIGTRGSKLALEQAHRVQKGIKDQSRIHIIKTSGDRFKDQPLNQTEDVGFFTKEIENALLSKEIDIAVHSLKDLPTQLAPGLKLAAVMARDEPSDLLLVHPKAVSSDNLIPVKAGATIGASSLRRQALLKTHQPELEPKAIRGNVPTRIKKVTDGEYDAIIISRAGLVRLGINPQPLLAFDLNPAWWTGAAGQGVIAIETRVDDNFAMQSTSVLDDNNTRICTGVERHLLVDF